MALQDLHKDAVPVVFETFLVPFQGPDGMTLPYELDEQKNPMLVMHMIQKIENNVAQFGSLERFMEVFQGELAVAFDAAERAVRIYEARKRQMTFLVEWAAKNSTKKDDKLDP